VRMVVAPGLRRQKAAKSCSPRHDRAASFMAASSSRRKDQRVSCLRSGSARFSALWRRYSYRVCDDPARADPLRRHETLWSFRRLDEAAMNEAARSCLGEHDFAAFCRRRPGATTIRTLRRLEWHRDADGITVATVVADAFCHHMVRSLAGALLAVGEGRRPPGWLAAVLAAAVRDPAVRVLPPHGLCLEEVGYPPPADLAARAAATRTLRAATS